MDWVYPIEVAVFRFLNTFLSEKSAFAHFLAYLCHKNENWLNVVGMLAINGLALYANHRSAHRAGEPSRIQDEAYWVIWCWLSFQFVLLINYLCLKWIPWHRNSPSLVLDGVFRLSDWMHSGRFKDHSVNSFPAGHALVLGYWLCYLRSYAPFWLTLIGCAAGILLMTARMASGAHWLTDTLFTLFIAWLCYRLSFRVYLLLRACASRYVPAAATRAEALDS